MAPKQTTSEEDGDDDKKAQYNKVKRSLRAHRGFATRYINEAKALMAVSSPDPSTPGKLRRLSDLLINKRVDIKVKNTEVEDLVDIGMLDAEIEEAQDNLDIIDTNLRVIQDWLDAATTSNPAPVPASTHTETTSTAKLPKLTLPTFSGDILEFFSFSELFKANVHTLPTLDDVQRFSYLKSCLRGEAATLVANLELTAGNYAAATKALEERYGDKDKIRQAHYRQLLNLDTKKETLLDLKSFYDQLQLHVRGLETLGKTQDSYGELLTMILRDKMSEDLRKTLARDHRKTSWTLEELSIALFREIQVKEEELTKKKQDAVKSPQYSAAAFTADATPKKKDIGCPYCGKSHKAKDCTDFTTVSQRLQVARNKGLCYNCLKKHEDGSSFAANCQRGSCAKCKGKHHTTLHRDKPKEGSQQQMMFVECHNGGILKSFTGKVHFNGRTTKAAILLDDGSTDSFCTERLAAKLNLPAFGEQTMYIGHFGSTSREQHTLKTSPLTLKTDEEEITIKVFVVPTISQSLPFRKPKMTAKDMGRLAQVHLADTVKAGAEIDLLIASDFYYAVVKDEIIRLEGGAVAVNTKFGYVLCGATSPQLHTSSINSVTLLHSTEGDDLLNIIAPEWTNDEEGGTDDESMILQIFLDNLEQDKRSGQYTAMLPWLLNKTPTDVPRNEGRAFHRTQHMVERFAQSPTLFNKLTQIFKEYIKRKFIERTPPGWLKTNLATSYLPWHAVYKESSVNTKIRVVFDCSCKDPRTGQSLNDFLWKGLNLTNDLVQILLRFRLYKVALTADIEKAFLAIKIRPEDRHALRFFFLEDFDNPKSKLVTYNFTVNLFGSRASSFILAAVLHEHLGKYDDAITRNLEQNILVDNIVTGVDDDSAALDYYTYSRTVFTQAAMNLRQWTTTSDSVQSQAKHDGVSGPTEVSVLGIKWDSSDDTLKPATPNFANPQRLTKRTVLSEVAKIFDPYGWLSPWTLPAKLFIQELWKIDLDWDEELDEQLTSKWSGHTSHFLEALKFKRQRLAIRNRHTPTTLHVFVDSSLKAYAAVAYVVNSKQTSLLFAKTRVAPIKQRTIPELELMAMTLGVELATFVHGALKDHVTTLETVYWSDSQVCIAWLNSDKPTKTFVSNRVKKIRQAGAVFNFVQSSENPADCATRVNIPQSHLQLWFSGPAWLPNCDPPSQTDEFFSSLVDTSKHKKRRRNVADPTTPESLIDVCRFSSLCKLQRSTAYVLRAVRILRRREHNMGSITEDEVQKATKFLVQQSQKTNYTDIFSHLAKDTANGLMRQLRIYKDDEGILRCRGRMTNCEGMTHAQRNPILLSNDIFALLVVYDCHKRSLHSGTRATLARMRWNFWIPRGRRFVKSVLRKCVTCKKVCGRPYTYPDPPALPEYRINMAPPFSATGIDYTGHVFIKGKGTEEPTKAYIAVFVCCITRAVHLELVDDLTKENFLLAFRRFCGRRSIPTTVITDNASYFLAGERHLEELMSEEQVQSHLTKHAIKWIHIPARSPAWGGMYERLVGIVKTTLKKVLGKALLTHVEMTTTLCEAEAAVNNRPLTYIEDTDAIAVGPLTPAHLLYGHTIDTLPYFSRDDGNVTDTNLEHNDLQQRLTYRHNLMKQFWTRWKDEYLGLLRERNDLRKRFGVAMDPSIGDVVLIHDDLPRANWKLGVIVRLFKKDGQARVAALKVGKAVTTRAIYKLYPLEVRMSEPLPPPETTLQRKETTDNDEEEVFIHFPNGGDKAVILPYPQAPKADKD